jgi:hypothetical protein
LCSERNATSSGDVPQGVSIKLEDVSDMDINVKEISVVKYEEEIDIDIQAEMISGHITLPKLRLNRISTIPLQAKLHT